MATAIIYSKSGTKKESPAKLDAKIFAVDPNPQLISQAYNAYLANRRSAAASTLTRGGVRGGGRKPWRQKGTGRARAGGTRLPHWTGGGVAHGPTGQQNYQIGMPVKAKRAAIRQALSLKAKDQQLVILEDFNGGEGKTAAAAKLLDKLGLAGRILLVVSEPNEMIQRATRNLAGVQVLTANYLNVFDIMNADKVALTNAAYDAVVTWLGVENER